ncbi:hypothetical protein GCM10009730_35800 [Streptomyces albidochromogenes]
MSAEPPSSGRPTGPPSGPLSGPTQPGQGRPTPPPETPSGPPYGPPGGGSTGGGGQGGGPGGPGGSRGPDRPWWRNVPRIATIATLVVAAVVVTVVLTRPDGKSAAGGEVFLEAAGSSGPDPYTESTAQKPSEAATASPTAPQSVRPSGSPTGSNVTQAVEGSEPGLYGGTRKVASCNVEKQISALTAQQDKNKAFASVLDIEPTGVPAYLRSLTPVQLRMDTRVTNHGYRNGSPTPYQSVLQAGTAVMVDDRGVPRVRCACGNPLRPPVAVQGTAKRTGDPWPDYRSSAVVTVKPAPEPVDEFVMFDPESDDWFKRDAGDTGADDEQTTPPPTKTKSPSPSADETSTAPPSEAPSTPPPGSDPPTSQEPPSEREPDSPAPESPAPESPAPESPVSPPAPAPDTPASEGPTE